MAFAQLNWYVRLRHLFQGIHILHILLVFYISSLIIRARLLVRPHCCALNGKIVVQPAIDKSNNQQKARHEFLSVSLCYSWALPSPPVVDAGAAHARHDLPVAASQHLSRGHAVVPGGLPLRMRPSPSEKEPLQQRTYVCDHNIANIAQIFVLRKVTKVFFYLCNS